MKTILNLDITLKSEVAREIVRDLWNDNYIYILLFIAIICFIVYQIIINAVKAKEIIANQEETIRLLKKIAGEPEDVNEEDSDANE
jgi:cell division protein FtsL